MQRQLDDVHGALAESHRLATLGTLASVVAHEYNNILTPIISYAQLALARPEDAALMRKAVERALASAERAARISSSLLGFARDDDGPPTARIRQALEEALSCLARDPGKDGIELRLAVADLTVGMSSLNLERVFVNLILNARQALRGRGGRLCVSAAAVAGRARIEVADTGPGIPPAILDRLFQPFVTCRPAAPAGDPGDATPRKGTGLGLCICRDLVRAAGGEITAASVPGQGATFRIDLPLAASARQAA